MDVDDGALVQREVNAIHAGIAQARCQSHIVDLVVHHQAGDRTAEGRFLGDLHKALRALPDCEFTLLSRLAQAPG